MSLQLPIFESLPIRKKRHYNYASPESKERLRQSRRGRRAWNKGLTKETSDKVKEYTEKSRKSLLTAYKEGRTRPWNAGIKIDRSTHPNMGHQKKHGPETISKMKMARKGKSAYWNAGEKSPMWKGGVTPENKRLRGTSQFHTWREAVFARDNWTCQKTKIKGGRLHPHHIQNFCEYPELRFDVNNGITLSEKAHREFHKKYGKTGNNREQLMEFLND